MTNIATSSSRRPHRGWLKLAAPLALLSLAACATPFRADVSRFQAMPAPQGQSFAVVAADPADEGGLEFARYADLVEAEMAQLGYVQARDAGSADLIVRLDYGIDKGQTRVVEDYDPFYRDPFFYRGYYAPIGYHRGRYVYGWHDPFLWGGYGFGGYGGVRSYTVYTSDLDLRIDRRADGQRLFEGKAEARSRSKNLTYLVPNLVEAMFTGFPGNSGETVRISVAPEKN